jgi:hypothetical protein
MMNTTADDYDKYMESVYGVRMLNLYLKGGDGDDA